jgi:hypothetical protein
MKLATILLFLSVGCANAAFVAGVDSGVSVIGPEYRSYVTADPTLDAGTKAIRLSTLDALLKLIAEAKK